MGGPLESFKAFVSRAFKTQNDATTTPAKTLAEPKPQFNQDMTTHHDEDINAISEILAEKIDDAPNAFTDIPLSDQTDDDKKAACAKCLIL